MTTFLMLCTLPEIRLGKDRPRITKKGEQFEVYDEVTRNLVIANKNAIDITNGVPKELSNNQNILLLQLESERKKVQELTEKLNALQQQVQDISVESDERIFNESRGDTNDDHVEEFAPDEEESEEVEEENEELSPQAIAIARVKARKAAKKAKGGK